MNPVFRQTRVMLSLLVVCLLIYIVRLYYRRHPLYSNDTGSVKVLITANMRSGSSFLGRILGWRNDTFYLFEPLWIANNEWNYVYGQELVCSSNECQRKHLQDIYRCNITKTNDVHIRAIAAPSWSVYRTCMETVKANKTACLEKESLFCKTKQNIVTKVVKMSLESAKPLLSIIPDLRIIHVLRDPRAIINSRVTTDWYRRFFKSAELAENNIQMLCSTMQSDIDVGKQLMQDFPDRFRFIQYEDFHDPVNKASRLYQYLGMRYTNDSVHTFFKTKINPRIIEKEHSEGFHPFSYRQTLPWKYVLLVNKYCSVVYKELELVQFNTEADFKNESISVIRAGLPFGLD